MSDESTPFRKPPALGRLKEITFDFRIMWVLAVLFSAILLLNFATRLIHLESDAVASMACEITCATLATLDALIFGKWFDAADKPRTKWGLCASILICTAISVAVFTSVESAL
jgi:ribonuclease PH